MQGYNLEEPAVAINEFFKCLTTLEAYPSASEANTHKPDTAKIRENAEILEQAIDFSNSI